MNLNDLNQLIESIIKNDSRIIKLTEEAMDDLYSLTAAEDKYLISRDTDYYQQFKNTRSDFIKRVDELEKIADTGVKIGLLADIKKFQGLYDVLIDERESLTADKKLQEKNSQTYVIDGHVGADCKYYHHIGISCSHSCYYHNFYKYAEDQSTHTAIERTGKGGGRRQIW
jgi:pheromone shutdown protein TraB